MKHVVNCRPAPKQVSMGAETCMIGGKGEGLSNACVASQSHGNHLRVVVRSCSPLVLLSNVAPTIDTHSHYPSHSPSTLLAMSSFLSQHVT